MYLQKHFQKLKEQYPGRKLLVVSNTAGASSWDKGFKIAEEVYRQTGVHVLSHSVKKPGCGNEIMEYFKQHPETGVTSPAHIAVVGDRLTTDMFLANKMGGFGFWIRDGVVPMKEKSFVSDRSYKDLGYHLTHCSSHVSSALLLRFSFAAAQRLLNQSVHSRSLEMYA